MLFKITSQLLTTRIFLKGMSCIMGFFVWYSISNSRTITRAITVPIYFDNKKDNMQINAPESMQITISGTRSAINASRNTGALHFDTARFSEGKKLLHAAYKNFLLPSAVKVLNCMPIEVSITPLEPSSDTARE